MSGAREELLTSGELGPEGIDLLYTTVRQVIRSRNVPPPLGYASWTGDQVMEVAHDVFADRGPQRLLDLASRSTDDASFRRQLWTTVVHHLASASRTSERGRLNERLKDVLPHVPGARLSGNSVYLGSADVSQRERSFDELVAAAGRVSVTIPRWSATSDNSAPVADRDSLVAVVEAVLTAVPNGVPYPVLVAVIATRLGIHDSPVPVDADSLTRLAPQAPDDPARTVENSDAGERLLRQLTIDEQMVLPYIEETSAVIADHTGFGRTKAWKIASALRPKVAALLEGDSSPGTTLASAADIARERWRLE